MFFIFLCLLLGQGALSSEYHINNTSDLIQFSKVVNRGTGYKGTTVFLDADIDFSSGFSEQFEPIGKSINYFQGTFDGQGHTISNLAINSSSQYAGLFGYSKRATIRNVVLDSSCSVVSSYNGTSPAYVGGIVGLCSGCTIENIVSMASVAFIGSTNRNLFIGGVAGYLYYSETVRNCANYGSVTHSGTVSSYARIGGIAGESYRGSSSTTNFIQNCLNYGTIIHSGTLKYLYIGGF